MPRLHPALQEYFATIHDGRVGVGEGVFDRVGTPRRWLQPFLRPLQRRGVLVAGWHRDVPFRIENRTVAGRAIAERTLELPGGRWIMRDAVALKAHGRVVDELGEPTLLAASFDVDVREAALHMTSRAIGIRHRGLRLRVPKLLAPVIRLTEGFDEESGRQRIELTVDLPLLGRIYEYGGMFSYRVEEDS